MGDKRYSDPCDFERVASSKFAGGQFLMWRCAVFLVLSNIAPWAWAVEEWPQFRGPGGQGHASGTNLPVTWSDQENIVWKTPIPGRGWSSPVVADGVVWVTTAIITPVSAEERERIIKEKLADNPFVESMSIISSAKLLLVSVDLKSGKLLKETQLFEAKYPDPIHSLNSYASPSPIVAAGCVYCHFGTNGTCCVDAKTGEVVWRARLVINHSVGAGSSPALHGGLLIVPCDGIDKQYVIALDAKTGKQVWRTDRPPMTGSVPDSHKAFTTPLVVSLKGVEQAIVPGAQWFVAYEPKTGKEIWRFCHGEGFSDGTRPVVSGNMAYICTGYEKPELCAVRIDGKGDVSEMGLAWKHSRQVPTMSSPLLVGSELYFVSEGGVLTCLDAISGKSLFQKRLSGNYSASPIFAADKIYFLNRDGKATVIGPGRNWKEIAVNELSGQFLASPAVIKQMLLLRSDSQLYCIGSGRNASAQIR